MRYLINILFFTSFVSLASVAWADSIHPFPVCPADYETVEDILDTLVDNGPGVAGDVWRTPTSTQRNHVIAGIYRMLNYPNTARLRFLSAGMDICLIKSSAQVSAPDTYVVYDPDGLSASSSVGLPVLLYRPEASVGQPQIILSIPHAKTESHLADDLTYEALKYREPAFNQLPFRAAVVSTVHRCHSDTALDPNGPSAAYIGSVSVSGCNGQMRLSDDAHNAESLFQAMHEELRRQFWDDTVVQIHGSGSDFPGISVSNGSGDHYNGPASDAHHATVALFRVFGETYDRMNDLTICHRYTLGRGEIRNPNYFATQGRKCGELNATRGEDPRRLMEDFPKNPEQRYRHFIHLEMNSSYKATEADRLLLIEDMTYLMRNDWQ